MQGTVISHTWLGMVEKRRNGGSANCGHCGLPTRSTISEFKMHGAKPRHAVICPRCAISKDAPEGFDVSLTMEGGDTLVLKGDLPDGDWTIGVRMGCQNDPLSIGLEWPRGSDGRPLKRFTLSGHWPPGPLRLAVILIKGLTLHILSLFARQATETLLPHARGDSSNP